MTNLQDLYPFDLSDQRLDRRAARIVQAALDHAGDSIPTAAGNLAAADATCRFFDNPNVAARDLDDAHARSTVDQAAGYPGVSAIITTIRCSPTATSAGSCTTILRSGPITTVASMVFTSFPTALLSRAG